MYEEHFGLSSRPFGAKAEGKDVFVGPEQTKATTRMHKGLTLGDSVAIVTGMVGVGKTTVVTRSLETIVNGRVVIWIGRMRLDSDELMALLLAGFGVSSRIKGTVRKFVTLKRLLLERAATVAPVAIVVEDAQRIGVDALAELEALTATDAGDGTSANIILMGQTSLNEFLLEPDLARLKQRVRLRQNIEPLTATEVQGYLKHCIREAGGNYDLIFAEGVADLVYQCSGGIPRVINNVCEAAMTAAMDEHSAQVTSALFSQVAAETWGYVTASVETAAITPDDDIENVLVDPTEAENPATTETSSRTAEKAAVSQDDLESQNEYFQNETDTAASSIEDDISTPSGDQSATSAEAELATPSLNEIVVPPEDGVKASKHGEPDIDWEAIAPPALRTREDSNEQTFSTKESSQNPTSARELIVESGNRPHIDTVISVSESEVENTHPTQEGVAESQPEAPEVTDTDRPNDSPEFDLSALPELINDTQPELRELPEITDGPAVAIKFPTLSESEATLGDAQSEIPTLVPRIESKQRFEALDPTTLPAKIIAEQEESDSEESLKEDELRDLDTALSVETESTNIMAGITANLEDVSSVAQEINAASPVTEQTTAEDSNSTNEESVTTTDVVTTGLNLDEMRELVTSHDNADTGDTTTSLELPTLSDSIRCASP
ncbi:MAG: AAA family ATPase [Woeseia sp.]|jgi:general secretion pathway protein A|nr:AAA family ATPase [Woeseia sp.]